MDSPSVATPPQQSPAFLGLAYELQKSKEFILDFVERSDEWRQPYLDVFDELWQNYLVTFDGVRGGKKMIWSESTAIPRPAQDTRRYGARLKDPESHQIVETLAAQALGIIFNPRDYLKAVPVGMDDPAKATMLSRVIMSVLEGPGVYRTLYQGFKDSFIFGTSILEVGWEDATRAQVSKQPVLGPMGMPMGSQLGITQQRYRFGPSIKYRDGYDFYPDPGGSRIHEDMDGVAIRFRISFAKARDLVGLGVYDQATTERAIQIASNRPEHSGKGGDRHPEQDDNTRRIPKDVGQLEGFEYWGDVPWQPSDGARNRVMTLLEGELVRSHINPYIDGGIPFKEIVVNPIGGRFYGLSPIWAIRYLQDSADNLLMSLNDAVDLAVNIPLLVGGGFAGNRERLKMRAPKDIIDCADPKAVAPVPVDIASIGLASQDLMRRKMNAREASGASNPIQAIPSSGDQTATESSLLARFGTQRISLIAQIFERDVLPWVGRMALSRLRQFGPPEFIAVLNGEQLRVPLEAIDVEADIRFVGSMDAMSELQKATNYEKGMTVLGNPDMLMLYPEYMARYMRDVLKFEDAERIVAQAIQSNQVKMLMEQMAAMAGQSEQAQAKGQPSPPKQKEENFGTQAGQTERQGEAVA